MMGQQRKLTAKGLEEVDRKLTAKGLEYQLSLLHGKKNDNLRQDWPERLLLLRICLQQQEFHHN